MISKQLIDIFNSSYIPVPWSGCWIWLKQMTITRQHYVPIIQVGTRKRQLRISAHRFSFIHFHGDIDQRIRIRQSCKCPYCVNPDHLEAFSNKEQKHGPRIKKDFCRKGHAILQKESGQRYCKQCSKDAKKAKYYAKKKESLTRIAL